MKFTAAAAAPKPATAGKKGWKQTIQNFLDRWPRLVSLAKVYFLFLILMLVSFGMGNIISRFEGPPEIEANNAYMRKAYMTRQLPLESTLNNLVALPAACLTRYRTRLLEEEEKLQTNDLIQDEFLPTDDDFGNGNSTTTSLSSSWNTTTNSTIETFIDRASADLDYLRMETIIQTDTGTSWDEFQNFSNVTFKPPLVSPSPSNKPQSDANNENDSLSNVLFGYVHTCWGVAEELVLSLLDFTVEVSGLENDTGGLTFDWIRCWNETSYGPAHIHKVVTEAQRNATLLSSQQIHFAEKWNVDREKLYERFVAELKCNEMAKDEDEDEDDGIAMDARAERKKAGCYWEAKKKSVMEATGKEGCEVNTASASWFWFTVMTTVGYGNTPPNTVPSRILVYCFGWLMIVAFGGIMVINAHTLTAILDDIFRRLKLTWLKKTRYSTPLWLVTNGFYIMLVAWHARRYWDLYAPHEVYTRADSYWFSYITLLTVGLGDFYIQPQGLFFWDVITWAFILLQGFGFMASFLDRFSELVKSLLPKRHKESLECHLARTDMFGTGVHTPVSKSLEILRELVAERGCDDDPDGCSDVEVNARNSFTGRDNDAKTPDGSTINLHRIKILTEKKSILIRLLLDNQAELDDRMASSAFGIDSSMKDTKAIDNGGGQNTASFAAIANVSGRGSSSAPLPMPTVEALERDEAFLNSILFRTQELRRHLGDMDVGGDGHDDDL